MSTAVPIIRGKGEGECLWFAGGGVHIWKATAEETDGAFLLVEDRITQGKTIPLHTHPNVKETIIVLEGEILAYAEGREHRVGPHGVAVAPRGDAHAFMVTSGSALILFLQTPGSGEAFYRDASEPTTDETDAERPPDLDRLRASAERHPDIIEILGPAPFETAKEAAANAGSYGVALETNKVLKEPGFTAPALSYASCPAQFPRTSYRKASRDTTSRYCPPRAALTTVRPKGGLVTGGAGTIFSRGRVCLLPRHTEEGSRRAWANKITG